MLDNNFSPWPCFTNEEVKAVSKVLSSNRVNYWTGQHGKWFEEEFSKKIGVEHSIALANGTLALELALRALNLRPEDEVIVTPRSFVASASAVVATGCKPVFADVDAETGNLTADTIAEVISPATKAVICVHLAGMPCDMDPILNLSKKYGLFVIEDCAQAHGAVYKGKQVGSIGDIGAWSFCQDKIITTGGEGGMVTTNSTALWKKMWSYKDHGKDYDLVHSKQQKPGFRWLHSTFGSNYRMTEMQAVIGRLQLEMLDEFTRKRNENAKILYEALEPINAVTLPLVPAYVTHAFYKCYIYLNFENIRHSWSRRKIIDEISGRGVPVFEGSCSEIYLESAFQKSRFKPFEAKPNAKMLSEKSVMFLVHPTLTQNEMEKTCEVAVDVLSASQR